MSLAQDIRNAYDMRDRDALERALAQIGNVTISMDPSAVSGVVVTGVTFGSPPREPITDCMNPNGCPCEQQQRTGGGCLWRRSTP